jgi:hypothetical protein
MTEPQGTITIHGEIFTVSLTPDLDVQIKHPKWSIVGFGRSTEEAKKDLLSKAKATAPIFREAAFLTPSSQELADWCEKVSD